MEGVEASEAIVDTQCDPPLNEASLTPTPTQALASSHLDQEKNAYGPSAFKTPLGKNPQNGTGKQTSKTPAKNQVRSKGKPSGSIQPRSVKSSSDGVTVEANNPKIKPHEDEHLVFQIMKQIQDQMHNQGSIFISGTKKWNFCYDRLPRPLMLV
ncbi:hypothetical protein SESBI_46749 [Sesbania bispinosa]|nr:hypothetical protein SESBI_46749 [Sesbania bispinosa]